MQNGTPAQVPELTSKLNEGAESMMDMTTSVVQNRRSLSSAGQVHWGGRRVMPCPGSSLMKVWRPVCHQSGLQGVRVAEASHPGSSRKRRQTQQLRALQRSWESDGESESDDAAFRGPKQRTLSLATMSGLSCQCPAPHTRSWQRWSRISLWSVVAHIQRCGGASSGNFTVGVEHQRAVIQSKTCGHVWGETDVADSSPAGGSVHRSSESPKPSRAHWAETLLRMRWRRT